MTITSLPIDTKALFAGAVAIRKTPFYEYKDGERTDKAIGSKFEIILPPLGYEKISVKVMGENLMEIPSNEGIPVFIEGPVVRIYCINGTYGVSAIATNISPKAGAGKP